MEALFQNVAGSSAAGVAAAWLRTSCPGACRWHAEQRAAQAQEEAQTQSQQSVPAHPCLEAVPLPREAFTCGLRF